MRPLDEWRSDAQFQTIAGHQIAWWSTGDNDETKPWLLLIHGYPTSSWDWTAVWPRLAKYFRLAAIDMLGFGLSDKPKSHHYTIVEQADFQEAFLEFLGVSEAHLLVHDYGNTVGQELLARHNEGSLSFSIKSLVFLNGGLFPEMHRARAVQKLGLTPFGPLLGMLMTKDKFRKTFDGIFGPETKASNEEIDGHWALINEHDGLKVLHRLLQYIPQRRRNRPRWVGALKDTTVPLRLIDGGFDPVSGVHLYHHYREQVPNADAILLESIGHYPHTEAPEPVCNAVLAFHEKTRTFIN